MEEEIFGLLYFLIRSTCFHSCLLCCVKAEIGGIKNCKLRIVVNNFSIKVEKKCKMIRNTPW